LKGSNKRKEEATSLKKTGLEDSEEITGFCTGGRFRKEHLSGRKRRPPRKKRKVSLPSLPASWVTERRYREIPSAVTGRKA